MFKVFKPSRFGIKLTGGLLVSLISFSCASAFANEDSQYWSTWQLSCKVSDQTAVKALAEVYLRDDMSDDYVYDQYLGLTHSLGHGFEVMGYAYRLETENCGAGWSTVWSAVGGISYQFDLLEICAVKLQDRFYYQVDPECELDHHRPCVCLTRELGWVKLTVSDEIRLDLSGEREDDFYRNRTQVMVSRELNKTISLGVGCVRQSDRMSGEWNSINALQTVVSYTFG